MFRHKAQLRLTYFFLAVHFFSGWWVRECFKITSTAIHVFDSSFSRFLLFSIRAIIRCEITETRVQIRLSLLIQNGFQTRMTMPIRTKFSHPMNRTILTRSARHDLLPPKAQVVFPHARSRVHVAFLLPAPDPSVDRRHASSGFPGDTARRLSPDPHPDHPGALGRVGRLAGLTSFHRRPRWKEDRRLLRQNSRVPPIRCSSGRFTGILLFLLLSVGVQWDFKRLHLRWYRTSLEC